MPFLTVLHSFVLWLQSPTDVPCEQQEGCWEKCFLILTFSRCQLHNVLTCPLILACQTLRSVSFAPTQGLQLCCFLSRMASAVTPPSGGLRSNHPYSNTYWGIPRTLNLYQFHITSLTLHPNQRAEANHIPWMSFQTIQGKVSKCLAKEITATHALSSKSQESISVVHGWRSI